MSVLTLRSGAFVPGTTQNLTSTGTTQQSAAVSSVASIIRVACQQDTFIAIGANPVADTSSMLISGGGAEFLAVVPGVTKVAVKQVSATGLVSITELTGY